MKKTIALIVKGLLCIPVAIGVVAGLIYTAFMVGAEDVACDVVETLVGWGD